MIIEWNGYKFLVKWCDTRQKYIALDQRRSKACNKVRWHEGNWRNLHDGSQVNDSLSEVLDGAVIKIEGRQQRSYNRDTGVTRVQETVRNIMARRGMRNRESRGTWE